MSESLLRVRICYQGTVQGVGFRMTAVSQSTGLDVVGWVMNESNGDVVLEAEGPKADIDQFRRRIRYAMNDRIEREQVENRQSLGTETRFAIRY